MTPPEAARSLRIAAVWGDNVLASRILAPGEFFDWRLKLGLSPPDHLVPEHPIVNSGGAWEIDPRGAMKGFLRLRGREEDVAAIAKIGAPVSLMPGDVALLQYGTFALFAQPVSAPPKVPGGAGIEAWIVFAFFLSAGGHLGIGYAIQSMSTPIPVPEPLELLSERQLKDQLGVLNPPDREEEKPKSADDGSGTGVKDPGLKDKKDMGGGKKIAGAAGKLGIQNAKGETRLSGDTPGIPPGSITELLGNGAGAQLTDTLKSMSSVAAITGGLKASDMQWGAGSGFALKGTGPGGGGKPGDVGVPFGSGLMNTGMGPGSGGGSGKGGGGISGKGTGGPGGGGSGGGNGTGEKKVAMVASGGGGAKGFSADEIRRVVMSHLGQVRACYESALDGNPGLRGSVTVAWHITAAGTVSRSTVASSTLGNGRVEGCITRVVKGWQFKNPDGVEADASWGFGLTPPN
jgi:hypothetical protein